MTTKTTPPLSLVPHLLKGFLEWFYANEIDKIHVQVVKEFVQCPELTKDWAYDAIRLNLSMHATRDLVVDDTGVSFSCYKNGSPVNVFFPLHALLVIEIPLDDERSYGFYFQDLVGIGQRVYNDAPPAEVFRESPNFSLDSPSPETRTVIDAIVSTESSSTPPVAWGTPVPPPRPTGPPTLKVVK